MGYTRYDLKKKNKSNFIFVFLICGILVLAFISGSIISKLFIKDINKVDSNTTKVPQQIVQPILSKNFIAIQCGVFSSKDNAEKVKANLYSMGSPFIASEDGKNKVILGIYTESEVEKIIKKLKDNGIEFSKVSFKYDLNSPCDLQIVEIIDAQLQITGKLSDSKVKSVQTKQLKEWSVSLNAIDKNEKNYNILKELKEYIKNLPDEVSKDKLEEYNIHLYKKLKELKI
ncbi:SPOR domain-containing protein [Clostridium bovifaecis]|uniref:SPOR domain-containing protein n=1 Tax=Clostridium bovifaecis TaxID=2184719 RepID=A0A6I6EVF0_9CLOT|nr:SPOR domain-containing protein [Clostridium bovifaecis]